MAQAKSAVAVELAQPEQEYIPPPPAAYLLTADDIGPGFRESPYPSAVGDLSAAVRFLAPDARTEGDLIFLSNTTVSLVESRVDVWPRGTEDEVGVEFASLLNLLRNNAGANVQPASGWGSEQVYSYTWAAGGYFVRGMVLKHRNVTASVAIRGQERFATWDTSSRLMSIMERRILAAVVQPASVDDNPAAPPASGPGAGPPSSAAAARLDPRRLTLTVADLPSGYTRDEQSTTYKEHPDIDHAEDEAYALVLFRPSSPEAVNGGIIHIISTVDRFTEPAAAERALRDRAQVSFSQERGFEEVAAPAVAESARAFVARRPSEGRITVVLVARRENMLFSVLASGREDASTFELIQPLIVIVDGRIQEALAPVPDQAAQ